MINPEKRLIVALDTSSGEKASLICEELNGLVTNYKIGLELAVSQALNESWYIVEPTCTFLDLKLPNDIPTTIEKTVSLIADKGIQFLSISESATYQTVEAAVKGRGQREYPKLLFVTNLSSNLNQDYRKRAKQCMNLGVDGFVASGNDVRYLRKEYANSIIVSPGIRPLGFTTNDHKRSCTPKEAIKNGADYIVVGRPITEAANKKGVVEDILEEIKEGLDYVWQYMY